MPRSIAKSRLEALLSMATGAAAEVPAGLAGLYGAATGGSGEGVRLIDKVRDKLTYQPRDPRGLQEIGRLVAPVANALERGRTKLGDAAFNATGSPALGAAAYTAPDALLSLLGARPALAAGRSASQGVGRAVARSAALPAPAMGSPASQIGAIRAYHGSPHDFDRFSMDHIGTGEGNAQFGHGMYFAGDPEVAQGYRNRLAGPDNPNGRTYEVNLDVDSSDLLDWDAPMRDQPEGIRAAMEPIVSDPSTKWALETYMGHQDPMDAPGGAVHRALESWGDDQASIAQRLRQAGIPGLRYLDGGSRAAGDGSRNYVMFDDSLIKILGKK